MVPFSDTALRCTFRVSDVCMAHHCTACGRVAILYGAARRPMDPPTWCRGAEARSRHSVGGGECRRRAAELRRLDGGSQERRAAIFQRFVIVDERTTHTTSRTCKSVGKRFQTGDPKTVCKRFQTTIPPPRLQPST